MRRIWVKYDEYLEGSTTPPPHAPTGELESAAAAPGAIVVIVAVVYSRLRNLHDLPITSDRAVSDRHPSLARWSFGSTLSEVDLGRVLRRDCGRTVPCRPSKARASHHMLGRDQARPYLELSPAVFGFLAGPWAVFGAVFVNTARISCSCLLHARCGVLLAAPACSPHDAQARPG